MTTITSAIFEVRAESPIDLTVRLQSEGVDINDAMKQGALKVEAEEAVMVFSYRPDGFIQAEFVDILDHDIFIAKIQEVFENSYVKGEHTIVLRIIQGDNGDITAENIRTAIDMAWKWLHEQ